MRVCGSGLTSAPQTLAFCRPANRAEAMSSLTDRALFNRTMGYLHGESLSAGSPSETVLIPTWLNGRVGQCERQKMGWRSA